MTDQAHEGGATLPPRRGAGRALARAVPWLVFATVLGLYATTQIRGFCPAYAEVDPDAYTFLAKRMALRQPLTVTSEDPFLYQLHMWVETAPGRVTSKYPPGFPLLMAVGYRLAGDRGVYMVSPVMGGLALIAAWLLFRLWLRPLAATLALVTLAIMAQFSFYGAYLLTHMTSLCLTTWGMYFLWRWLARPAWGWGLAAGAILGAATTVRPTDGLLVLPLAAAALVGLWRGHRAGRIPWGATLALGAAWALPVMLLALFNYAQFGSPTVSGYALSGEQNTFSFDYLTRYFGMLMAGLNQAYLPLFFPLGLAGMMLIGAPADRALRLLWLVPVLLIYGSYYWVNENWSYLRFFMGALPVCIGSAFALLERIPAGAVARTCAMVVLVGLHLALNLGGLRNVFRGELIGHNPYELARVAEKMEEKTAADAVVFARGHLGYSLGPRRSYLLYDLDAFNRGHSLSRQRDADRKSREYEPRRQPERVRRLREFYEGTTDVDLLEQRRNTVRQHLEAGRQVVFLLPAHQRASEAQALGDGFRLKPEEEWDLEWDAWGRRQKQRWGIYTVATVETAEG
ncbi:MAG: hypothetical protein BWZ02_01274 [Lentisphaerae bacterium ADurb.BinA184]|nr:MAG: hypothetical protein BWZ02_01274 [Lentisphaerae bacterium ADurb.BinA184]